MAIVVGFLISLLSGSRVQIGGPTGAFIVVVFGWLPATGAIARTATNVRAGGKTPVAGLVHAMTILVIMLVASRLVGYPKERKSDTVLLVLTMVLAVFADLTVAIGVGVALGLAFRLQRRDSPASKWSDPDRQDAARAKAMFDRPQNLFLSGPTQSDMRSG